MFMTSLYSGPIASLLGFSSPFSVLLEVKLIFSTSKLLIFINLLDEIVRVFLNFFYVVDIALERFFSAFSTLSSLYAVACFIGPFFDFDFF